MAKKKKGSLWRVSKKEIASFSKEPKSKSKKLPKNVAGPSTPSFISKRTSTELSQRVTSTKSSKKERKQLDKALGETQSFSGSKEPSTKEEKRLARKGKEVRRILSAGTGVKSKEVTPTAQYRRVPIESLRVGKLQQLKTEKKDVKESLKDVGDKSKPGIAKPRQQARKTELANIEHGIVKLKQDAVKGYVNQAEKNIEKIQKIKKKSNDPAVDKRAGQEIRQQKEGLKALKQKNQRLRGKEFGRKTKAQKLQSRQEQRVAEVGEYLEDTKGDITAQTFLSEKGIRIRGKGTDKSIKVPGIPGWSRFDLDEPSSALEDALNTASWLPVGGAALGAGRLGLKLGGKVLGRGVPKATQVSTKSSSLGIRGKALGRGLKHPLRTMKGGKIGPVVQNVDDIGKASEKIISKGSKVSGAAKDITAVVSKDTITAAEKITTRTGAVIEHTGKVAPQTASKVKDITKAADDTILSVVDDLAKTIPGGVSPYKLAARSIGRKAAKGGAFVGGAAFIPQVALGVDPDDAAKRIFRDAYDFAVGVIPSTYVMGAAGFEAIVKRDDSRATELWEMMKEHDPIVLAFQGEWGKAVDAYKERPFSTALEVAGFEYMVGRSVGALGRQVPATRQLASLSDDLRLGPKDTYAIAMGRYSPDIFRKFGVIAGRKLESKARPVAAKERVLKRTLERVDREAGVFRNENLRMMNEVTNELYNLRSRAAKISKNNTRGPNALPFMISRIARNPETAALDLIAYRQHLAKKFEKNNDILTGETIKVLDDILAEPEILGNQKLWNIADEFIKNENKRQEDLIKISSLSKGQAEAAAWIPYLVSHMKAKFDGKTWNLPQTRSAKGQFQTTKFNLRNPDHIKLIENHAKANGVGKPGFFRLQGLNENIIPITKNVNGQAVAFHKRTHKAIDEGTFDPTYNALYSHAMRTRHTIGDGNHAIKLAELFTPYRTERGTMQLHSHREIEAKIKKEVKEGNFGEGDYVPFSLEVYKSRVAAMRGMGEDLFEASGKRNFDDSTSSAMIDALDAAINSKVSGTHYVAMPKVVIDRLVSHGKVDDVFYRTGAGKFVRGATREFKGAVLPFNPRWGLGNIMDMTFRMMMDQSGGPAQWALNWARGRKELNKLKKTNPDAYHELSEQLGHGLLTESFTALTEDNSIASSVRQQLGNNYKMQVNALSTIKNPAQHYTALQRSLLVAKGLGEHTKNVYRKTQEYNPLGFRPQRFLERQVRTAAFGKADRQLLKDLQGKYEESILLTPKAIEDTVQRLSDSNVQSALAEKVNGVLGDYSRMSPAMRTAVFSYSPFALWWRASSTWVLTLPAKHPAKTAFLASVNRLTEPDRAAIGLSALNPIPEGEEQGRSGATATKPPFLLGSLPLGDTLYPTRTLSSFGSFYEPASLMGDFFIPQISSSINIATLGVNWTGEELVFPNGREPSQSELAGIAVSNLVETYLPALRWMKIAEAEGAPDDTATILDPKPSGKRETYISQFPGSKRYEQPEKEVWETLFSPFKTYPLEPEETSKALPRARYGSAASMYGAADKERVMKSSAAGQGWLQGEEAVENLDLPKPKKKKPTQNWLQSEMSK